MLTKFRVKSDEDVVAALAGKLLLWLGEGKKVLWLVSGGSSLPVASAVSKKLQSVDTSNLFVTLVDDKFNTPEEATNWQQLKTLGFVAGQAKAQGILQTSLSLQETAEQFDTLLAKRLAWADVAIGQFGIGEGQHTGGILANSPAAREQSKLAIGYIHAGEGKITITPTVIKRLNVAFINSMGEGKRSLIQHFLRSTASIFAEPTQSLKTAKQTLLYSDVL